MPLIELFENSSDLVFVIDEQARVVETNRAFDQLFREKDEIGSIFALWPELESTWGSLVTSKLSSGIRKIRTDVTVEGNSSAAIYDLEIFPACESEQSLYVGVARNVTQDRHEHQRLQVQVTTDDLTGLFVRSQLDILLDLEIRRAIRRKSSGCFLFIDMDTFKGINDVHGHTAGDRVLKAVSDVLQSNLRDSDVVARMGGDEFGVVLADASLEHGVSKAESLAAAIGEISVVEGVSATTSEVHVSIGVSAFPDHADTPQKIIQLADEAMYLAKSDPGRAVVGWDGHQRNS